MNLEDLLQKYLSLAAENEALKKENERLREKLQNILPSCSSECAVHRPADEKH